MTLQAKSNRSQSILPLVLSFVLFGLIVLGVADPARADNAGTIIGLRTCDGEIKSTKEKIKGGFSAFKIIPNFPNFDLIAVIDADGIGGVYVGSGVAVAKNKKVSEFHAKLAMDDERKFYFTGKFNLDPKANDPVVLKASGKMFGIDHTHNCIFTGKFKTASIALGNLPPIASFIATPQSGGAPLKVSFDASGSQDPDESTGDSIASYSWDFGDGDMSSGEMVEHTYPNPGSFTAELTVTDSLGLTGTTSVLIQALDVMAPVVTAPESIIVPAESFSGTPVSNAAIAAFLSSASALDETDGAIIPVNDAQPVFPVGETVVTFWATDAAGNTGMAMASVAVTPLAVTPTPANQAKVSQIIGPGGGTLGTMFNGAKFVLEIPPDALTAPVEISLCPVSALTGQPAGVQFLAAAQFEPTGLNLLRPALFTIELPSPPDPATLVGFGYKKDGDLFHFLPIDSVEGTLLQFSLLHFSGEGGATTQAIPPASGFPSEEAALNFIAAILLNQSGNNLEDLSLVGINAIINEMHRWFTMGVRQDLLDAIESIEMGNVGASRLLEDSINQLFAWRKVVEYLAGIIPQDVFNAGPNSVCACDAEGTILTHQSITAIVDLLQKRCAQTSNVCEGEAILSEAVRWQHMADLAGVDNIETACEVCGGGKPIVLTLEPRISSITVNQTVDLFPFLAGLDILFGGTCERELTDPASNQTFTWSSSNDLIATVTPSDSDSSAKVTPLQLGLVAILAITESSCSEDKATAIVEVVPDISGVWSAIGTSTVVGCPDPEDNGVFTFFESVTLFQTGSFITVSGIPGSAFLSPPVFGANGAVIREAQWLATVHPGGPPVSAAGALTDENTSTVIFSGTDGEGCSFTGSGTATRQTP